MPSNLIALLLESQIASAFNSPFIVPVAGCAMIASISVAKIWSAVRDREIKSHERLAMIAQGMQPEPVWQEQMMRQATASNPGNPRAAAVPNNGAGARRAGLILCGVGCGLILFFITLSVIVRVREVLSGSAAGLIPLAIGIGFLVDSSLRRREYERWAATASFAPAFPDPVLQPSAPTPPPPGVPQGLTPAQASDWRPLQ